MAEKRQSGRFLDVTPQERIVFTSMLVGGWRPASPGSRSPRS
jgi:hypothetical protein